MSEERDIPVTMEIDGVKVVVGVARQLASGCTDRVEVEMVLENGAEPVQVFATIPTEWS